MSKFSFGVNLPVSGRSYSGAEFQLDFRVIKEIAMLADANGFASIGVHDHLLNPQGSSPGGKEMPEKFRNGVLEGWTTLTSLSTITSRARLTNVVLCNLFRNPALLAKMAATLDIISEGRMILALGAGWFRTECKAYGIEWKPYAKRLQMLRESVQMIKKFWTDDEVTFAGIHYQVEGGMMSPKPMQKPHPPIVVGGSSENVMRLAVDEADGWDVDTGPCPLEMFQERYARLEEYCTEVGRARSSIRISANATPFLARSIPEAKRMASRWAAFLGADPERYVSGKAVLLGTAEDILGSAEKWFESGVNQMNFLMPHDVRYAEDFFKEINTGANQALR